jgi:TolB-like protein/cytochrome c-type biogenesis protein CcmH/NrfG
LSAAVADSARPRLEPAAFTRPIRWQAHGSYRLKGFDEPLEIREVGIEGVAPFAAPSASDKAAPRRPNAPTARRRWALVATVGALVVLGAAADHLLHAPADKHPGAAPPAGPSASTATPAGDVLAIAAIAGRPAIAVLPLDDLSADPTQAFFADGLGRGPHHATLDLARLPRHRPQLELPVPRRQSRSEKVGAELGARYLVEGSVRRDGDRIRVTAQLIDAPSGEHVWARPMTARSPTCSLSRTRSAPPIAASIASDLTRRRASAPTNAVPMTSRHGASTSWASSTTGGRARTTSRPSGCSSARQSSILASRPHWHSSRPRSSGRSFSAGATHTEQTVATALAGARRAVELDPRDPAAQNALGFGYLMTGDVHGGLEATQRAVALNPSMPEAWTSLAYAQLLSGDPDGSIASNQRAIQLNPQGRITSIADDNLAFANWETGHYDASIDAARRLIAARPTYYWGYLYLALNAVSRGHLDEARAAIAEARRVQPNLSFDMIQKSIGVPRPEVDARRNAALREAGLE